MRALVVDPRPQLTEVADPDVREGEALVKVLMAGICGTDLELMEGYRHFKGIPGHEMVGVVEEAPDPAMVGVRVVPEINIACRECTLCRQGLGKHCENRQVLGLIGRPGAFAERVAVPLDNLHRVPDGVSDEDAVWTEPLAAALGVGDVGIPAGDPVLVLGDGRLGALTALGLASRGARIELCGKDDEKLGLLEGLGVAINRQEPQPRYFWVVEATGSAQGIEAALAWTKPTGCIILKSTCRKPSVVDASRIVVDEIRVIGSRCGAFPPALELISAGKLPLGSLVSRVYPFEQVGRALEESSRPGVFKVLLDFRS